MIELREITKSFPANPVLRGVSFQLQPQSLTGLIGPGGGGKSVLMKIIAGVLAPDSGSVDMHGLHPEEIGLMFQEGALFDSLSVLDNVAFPLVGGKVPVSRLPLERRTAICGQVEDILRHVGLVHAAHKIPAQLSGGMRRRVSLARALVSRPKLLLLDDPTFGLDPVASNVIMKLITDLHAEYKPTCLMISQDLRRLLPVVERFLFLGDGKIQFEGTLGEFRAQAGESLKYFVSCRYDLGNGESAQHP